MRRKNSGRLPMLVDDIETAGTGGTSHNSIASAPSSRGVLSTATVSDLEIFDDLISEPVLVLGVDISHLSRRAQFILCASGVFCFSLLYGFLQELLSVQLCSRKLGLYLASVQFSGYTGLSYILREFVYRTSLRKKLVPKHSSANLANHPQTVSFTLYLGLSLLRALDLGMTNLAMQYLNYPAKTLMKSSRIVFTMIFGVLIYKKSYGLMDYLIVFCIVAGLAIFMHADANSSAVFAPTGVMMLSVSLICDGAITNMSENIMKTYGVGQDEFIFRMYSIALVAISAAAALKGDVRDGVQWMFLPGTYDEQINNVPISERTWSVGGKIMVLLLFSTMGFFGSSCSAAITKNFGALTMSITSTARKATTLFLSFLLFNNTCTVEHIMGIVIFMTALTAKSLRRGGKKHKRQKVDLDLRQSRMSQQPHGQLSTEVYPSDSDNNRIPTTVMASASFDSQSTVATNNTDIAQRRSNFIYNSNGRTDASTTTRRSPKVRYHVV